MTIQQGSTEHNIQLQRGAKRGLFSPCQQHKPEDPTHPEPGHWAVVCCTRNGPLYWRHHHYYY